MGWDIWAEIDTGGEQPARVTESFNYTYNTSPMLYAVGIDWHELTGKPISEALPVLDAGIASLEAEPERFTAMNPPNGWGSYDSLLMVLRQIRDEFAKHPKAVLGSWL